MHAQTVVAGVLHASDAGRRRTETRTFATTTAALLALAEWLRAACTHGALESTGSYWKPVYNILEGSCTVLLVNAAHIKKVPRRKTDVGDSAWSAELVPQGLLQPSFVPDRAQRELRDLPRTRTTLIDERAAVVNRLQAVLEDAHIKVAGVATDIMGAWGRDMRAALLEGTATAAEMAHLARGRMRRKRAALEQALQGRVTDHHRVLLLLPLEHAADLEEQIARLSAAIEERLRPCQEEVELRDSSLGIGRHRAEVLSAEIGTDMNRFPSAAHVASWAGMCHDTTYQEQEWVYLDERRRARTQQRALAQLKALGYAVTLTPRTPAA